MSITGATNKFNIKICKIGEIKKMIDKRRKSTHSKEDIKCLRCLRPSKVRTSVFSYRD